MKKIIIDLLDHLRTKGMIYHSAILGNKKFEIHSKEDDVAILRAIHKYFSSSDSDLLEYIHQCKVDDSGDEMQFIHRFQFINFAE